MVHVPPLGRLSLCTPSVRLGWFPDIGPQALDLAGLPLPLLSDMELWGPYLLLCLFSLLSQVTTEAPTPRPKKAVISKKGKSGMRAHRLSLFLLDLDPHGDFREL